MQVIFGPLILCFSLVLASVTWAKPEQPETLASFLSHAINHSPAIAEAAAAAEAASYRAKQVRGTLLPQIRANASWGVQTQPTNFRDETRHPNTQEITVRQPLSLSEEWLAWRSAQAEADALNARARGVVQETILRVTQAYLDSLVAQTTAQQLEKLVQNLKKLSHGVKRQFEEGENTLTGTAQANTRLVNAQAELARAQATQVEAEQRLQAQSGKPVKGLLSWPKPPPQPKKNLGIEKNPQFQEAEARLRSAQAQRRQALTGFLPEFSLDAAHSRNSNDFNGNDGKWSDRVIFNASFPLFNGGQTYYGAKAAQATMEAAEATLERLSNELVAGQTAEKALVTQTLEAIKAYQDAVTEQKTAIRGARLEYDNGERSLTELLNAEEEAIQVAIRLDQAKRDRHLSLARWRSLVGQLSFPD